MKIKASVLVLVLYCLCIANSVIEMATVGGIHDSDGSQNALEIENLARFAVDEHNKKQVLFFIFFNLGFYFLRFRLFPEKFSPSALFFDEGRGLAYEFPRLFLNKIHSFQKYNKMLFLGQKNTMMGLKFSFVFYFVK